MRASAKRPVLRNPRPPALAMMAIILVLVLVLVPVVLMGVPGRRKRPGLCKLVGLRKQLGLRKLRSPVLPGDPLDLADIGIVVEPALQAALVVVE